MGSSSSKDNDEVDYSKRVSSVQIRGLENMTSNGRGELNKNYHGAKKISLPSDRAVLCQTPIIIGSLITLILSSLFYGTFAPIFSSLELAAAPLTLLIFSTLLLVSSTAVCVAEQYFDSWHRALEILVSLSVFATFISGVALIAYLKYFDGARQDDIETRLEENIVTFSLAVFKNCCDQTNPDPSRCSNLVSYPCFHEDSEFEEALEYVGDGVCGLFEKAGIVSQTDSESCSGQQEKQFVMDFVGYIWNSTAILGSVALAFSILLSIPTGYVLWKYWNDESRNDFDDEEVKQEIQATLRRKREKKQRRNRKNDLELRPETEAEEAYEEIQVEQSENNDFLVTNANDTELPGEEDMDFKSDNPRYIRKKLKEEKARRIANGEDPEVVKLDIARKKKKLLGSKRGPAPKPPG